MKVQFKEDALKIPNLFGYFRVILAIIFAIIYLNADSSADYYLAAGIIALSGLTDFIDGQIARRFNMITELGKILDPIADKITQGILAFCLATKFPWMTALVILYLIKEIYMAVAGLRVLKKIHKNEGARWYGKVSTAVLYFVTFVLILFPDMPDDLSGILIGICFTVMLMSFILYVKLYRELLRGQS